MLDRESLEKYEERLKQWEARLERDTRQFHWMMVGGIFGGFVMISALGIWVYLAYILAAQ